VVPSRVVLQHGRQHRAVERTRTNAVFRGNLPLAIQTANAYHDQVDIPIQ